MSFTPYPGVPHLGVWLPGGVPVALLWHVGVGIDEHLIAWADVDACYIASRTDLAAAMRMAAPSGPMELQASSVGGRAWWTGAGGTLYYVSGFGWVYAPANSALRPGWPPIEWQDAANAWHGDEFYVAVTLPGAPGDTVTCTPRGSLRGGAAISITRNNDWPRWQRTGNQYGVYTAAGGAAGSRSLGTPVWGGAALIDGSPARLVRSNAKDAAGHYEYTSTTHPPLRWHDVAGVYVMGVYGAAGGWRETAEAPVPGQPVTLTFAWPVDADPPAEGGNYALTPRDWVAGDGSRAEVLVGSVATYIGELVYAS